MADEERAEADEALLIGSPEDTSALRQISIEAHELFEELRSSGFEDNVASQIIARFLSDRLYEREEYDDDDFFDEDDPESDLSV